MKKKASQKQLGAFVLKAQKGDSDAFAKLYSYLAPSVYYIVLKIVKNQHDADDIVQETFIKLYSNINEIRNPITVVSFTNRIAYNTALAFLEKRNRTTDLIDEELEYELYNNEELNSEFIPEEYYEQKEKREEVLKILDDLGEINRAVVIMFYYNDMPIKEISQTLNVAEETVKGRLFRAREKIKTDLMNDRNIQKGIFAAMSATVLSKILELDAQGLDFADNHVGNWANIVEGIGLSSSSISTTNSTVSSIVKSNYHIMSNNTIAGHAGSSALKVLATVVSSTVIIGSGVSLYQEIKAKNIYDTKAVVAANSQETAQISDSVTIDDQQFDISSSNNPPKALDDINDSEMTPPKNVLSDSRVDDAKEVEAQIPPSLAKLPTNSSPVTPGIDIALSKHILRYPKGRAISKNDIIRDSGVTSQTATQFEIFYLEKVEIMRPKQYGIYIQAKNSEGLASNVEGIIIIIE